MIQKFFLSLLLSLTLIACAGKRVTDTTSPQDLGSEVGYVGFSYEAKDGESAEMWLRHVESGNSYRFRLDRPVGVFQVGLGPFTAYQKIVGETDSPPMTLIPLPAGTYEGRFLRLKVAHPPWRAFLLQRNSAEASRSLAGRSLSIAADSVTYIGTYRTRATAGFFGDVDYSAKVVDEGAARAEAIGVSDRLRVTLLSLD